MTSFEHGMPVPTPMLLFGAEKSKDITNQSFGGRGGDKTSEIMMCIRKMTYIRIQLVFGRFQPEDVMHSD